METFKVQKQTEAEKDDFLVECFHDAGFIESLKSSNYSIISGRKGTGKTALAKYLEQKSKDYNIDLAYRISIRSVSLTEDEDVKDRKNSILSFIIIKSIQKLLKENFFADSNNSYWIDFLTQNGLQNTSDYETFIETRKTNKTGFSIKGMLSYFGARAESGATTEGETQLSRTTISSAPSSLIQSIIDNLQRANNFCRTQLFFL